MRKLMSERMLLLFPLFLILIIFFKGCTDEEGAIRVLHNNGYSNVEITGWRPFMKSEKDWFSTGFIATSPSGNKVSGAVTGGFFKGNIIRFD